MRNSYILIGKPKGKKIARKT